MSKKTKPNQKKPNKKTWTIVSQKKSVDSSVTPSFQVEYKIHKSCKLTFTEVSSLNHEVFYNSMKKASFVVKRFLSSLPNAFLTWTKPTDLINNLCC